MIEVLLMVVLLMVVSALCMLYCVILNLRIERRINASVRVVQELFARLPKGGDVSDGGERHG